MPPECRKGPSWKPWESETASSRWGLAFCCCEWSLLGQQRSAMQRCSLGAFGSWETAALVQVSGLAHRRSCGLPFWDRSSHSLHTEPNSQRAAGRRKVSPHPSLAADIAAILRHLRLRALHCTLCPAPWAWLWLVPCLEVPSMSSSPDSQRENKLGGGQMRGKEAEGEQAGHRTSEASILGLLTS